MFPITPELHKCFFFRNTYLHFLFQKSKRSFDNFDPEFTDEAARLTPCDKSFIANINPKDFEGFSYVNPEFESTETEINLWCDQPLVIRFIVSILDHYHVIYSRLKLLV